MKRLVSALYLVVRSAGKGSVSLCLELFLSLFMDTRQVLCWTISSLRWTVSCDEVVQSQDQQDHQSCRRANVTRLYCEKSDIFLNSHTSKNTKAITAEEQERKLPLKTRTLPPPRRKPSGDTVPVTDGSALVRSVQLEPSCSSGWTSQSQAAEPSCQSKGTS
ncbi:hypothetical protein SRHO_G00035370 [Serrasalmus rhombeus]